MHYVKHFNVLGVDAAQIPCIELQGIPTTATEGAVGVLGVNMASADHEIYICVGVKGTVYTWIPLKGDGGVTITKAEVNEIGELIITLSNSAEINAGVVAGSGCFVNGVATDVNFTANPQDQIDGCVKKAGDTVEGQLLLPNSPTTPDEGTVTNAYTTRKTANSDMTGLEVVDGSVTHIQEIKGSTVKSKNLVIVDNHTVSTNNNAYSLSYPTKTTSFRKGETYTWAWDYKIVSYVPSNSGAKLGFGLVVLDNETGKTQTIYYSEPYSNQAIGILHRQKVTFVSPYDCDIRYIWFISTNGTNTTTLEVSNVIIEEGATSGKYIPYFTDLKNANINSIVSTGKNLLSGNPSYQGWVAGAYITTDFESFLKYFVIAPIGTKFTLSADIRCDAITNNPFDIRLVDTDSNGATRTLYFMNRPTSFPYFGTLTTTFTKTYELSEGYSVRMSLGNSDTNSNYMRNIQIQVGDTATEYEPYVENLYHLSQTIELAAFDKLLPQEGKLVKQTGYVTSGSGFTDEQIASYDSAIVSGDRKSIAYKLSTAQVVDMDIPKVYTVWNDGTETIVQGEVDDSEFGAIPTITQTYSIHENPKEVAIKEYVNNALAKKLDKTGGTITGNLVVEGKTDTALGAVISKQGDVIYGLAYENEAYKLGQGEIDENGDFSFRTGEGLPIALRDDSSTFTDGNFVCWNAEKNKLVDSGKNPSTLVTKKWKHTITISGTKTTQLTDSNGSSHIVTLNYELTVDRFSTRSTQMKSLLEIRDYCSNTKGVGVCQLTVKDFDDSSVEYINDLETVTIGAIDGSGYMSVKGLFAESAEHNQGLTVSRISFTIGSNDSVTITDSVYEI